MITTTTQAPVGIETSLGDRRGGAQAALVDRLLRLFEWADAHEVSLHAAFDAAEILLLEKCDPAAIGGRR